MIEINEYIDGSKFEQLADLGFGDKYTEEKPLNITVLYDFFSNFDKKRLPLIYVDSDRVLDFFNLIRDADFRDFALLSHNGDTTFVTEHLNLKPKFIKKWFGQNINVENNNNIFSLPIGLERPHWSQSRYGVYGFKHNKIYEYSKIENEKKILCYLNFNQNTNVKKRSWIVPFFQKESWCDIKLPGINGSLDTYFNDCKMSHFVICPDGNGIDCHRNWEMLYLNVTPIVESSDFHKMVYSDLPVLIVDNFKKINKIFLEEEKNKIKIMSNKEKLKFSYWSQLILKNL